MPIQVVPLGPSGAVGPSVWVPWTTTVFGPPEVGSELEVQIYSDADQTQLWTQWTFPYFWVLAQAFKLYSGDETAFSQDEVTQPADGDTVYIKVTIQQPTAGVFDTGTTAVTWKVLTDLPQTIQAAAAKAQGLVGLQADELAQAAESVVQTFVQGAEQITVPISNLLRLPELIQLALTPTPIVATGSGTISNATLSSHLTFGLWWEFVDVPAGIGRSFRTGFTYEPIMLELSEVGSVLGNNLSTAITTWSIERLVYIFHFPKPDHFDYWVYPGVTCNIHTLVLA